ncbi:hypothetical protein E2C01_027745 [Portunus trituberculatus]|uniref:Uncharacterized protein n=1 Tax=Portunus trituberculatus TaxID=210409 RepID=A0A5B7EIN6_PORTR|nr:hypothetical protein [Portunus trituberculatus]
MNLATLALLERKRQRRHSGKGKRALRRKGRPVECCRRGVHVQGRRQRGEREGRCPPSVCAARETRADQESSRIIELKGIKQLPVCKRCLYACLDEQQQQQLNTHTTTTTIMIIIYNTSSNKATITKHHYQHHHHNHLLHLHRHHKKTTTTIFSLSFQQMENQLFRSVD